MADRGNLEIARRLRNSSDTASLSAALALESINRLLDQRNAAAPRSLDWERLDEQLQTAIRGWELLK